MRSSLIRSEISDRVRDLRVLGEKKRSEFKLSQLNKLLKVVPERPYKTKSWVNAVSENYIKTKIRIRAMRIKSD